MTVLLNFHAGIPFLYRIPAFVLGFYLIDLVLGFAYLVNVSSGCQIETLNNFLNLEREANLPTWYSSLQLSIAAALLAIFAYWNFRLERASSWVLLLFPLLLLVLSMDESTEIHEWMGYKSDSLLPGGDRKNTPFYYTGIWMFLIGIPFLIGFTALLMTLRTYFRTTRGVLFKFLLGGFLLVGGATGVETATNFIPLRSWLFYSEIFLEEVLEMVGVTTILWGAYSLLEGNGFSIHLVPVKISPSPNLAARKAKKDGLPDEKAPAPTGFGTDHG
jgi:hypothetical protein